MVLDLNLTREVEAALANSAARAGMLESEYVAQILAHHLETQKAANEAPRRSILELRGLGAEMWRHELHGRDAQDVVNEDRDSWSARS